MKCLDYNVNMLLKIKHGKFMTLLNGYWVLNTDEIKFKYRFSVSTDMR